MTNSTHNHGHEHAHEQRADTAERGGLAASSGGYTLEVTPTQLEAGAQAVIDLHIRDARGNVVREFEMQHEARLHLIVVRRDLAHFQHLHPKLHQDGTWSVRLTLPEAGSYRAFTDFVASADRQPRTLGVDLAAPGEFAPGAASKPSNEARSGDYDLRLEGGPWEATIATKLSFTVRHRGEPVRDLDLHLGALGHLVVLREGDLAYLHVHPMQTGGRGPSIDFHVAFPSPGRYRLFLQFNHGGSVRTVEFTLEIPYRAENGAQHRH